MALDDVSQYVATQYSQRDSPVASESEYSSESEDSDDSEKSEEEKKIEEPHTPISTTNPPLFPFENFVLEFDSKSESQHDEVAFIDVEWHNLKREPRLISQISAVSLDGTVRHNTYIKYKDLSSIWLELVDIGIVTLDRTDSTEAVTLCECMQLLMHRFKRGTTFLFAGNIDGDQIAENIFLVLSDNLDLIDRIKEHNFKFLSVNALLLPEIKEMKLEGVLCSKTGSTLKRVPNLFDIMFYKYVVVKGAVYRPDVLDAASSTSLAASHTTKEKIEDMLKDDQVVLNIDFNDETELTECMDVEFRAGNHIEPVFHTAGTDVTILRDIVAFWYIYRCIRRGVEIARGDSIEKSYEAVTSMPPASFCETSTVIVELTKYLRKHLVIDVATRVWIKQQVASLNSKSLAGKLDALKDGFIAFDGLDTRQQVLLLKRKRGGARTEKELPMISIKEAPEEAPIQIPLFINATNRSKLEAIRAIVSSESTSFADAFEEHEAMRRDLGLEEVGDRPWYYLPGQFGKKLDNTYILHCRHCDQFRLKGDDTGLKKKRAAGSVKLTSINVEAIRRYGHRLLSYFIYCKECKHYEGEETVGDISTDGVAPFKVSHIELLCVPTKEPVCVHSGDVSTWRFTQRDERTKHRHIEPVVEPETQTLTNALAEELASNIIEDDAMDRILSYAYDSDDSASISPPSEREEDEMNNRTEALIQSLGLDVTESKYEEEEKLPEFIPITPPSEPLSPSTASIPDSMPSTPSFPSPLSIPELARQLSMPELERSESDAMGKPDLTRVGLLALALTLS